MILGEAAAARVIAHMLQAQDLAVVHNHAEQAASNRGMRDALNFIRGESGHLKIFHCAVFARDAEGGIA
jgi:hypothetical protein